MIEDKNDYLGAFIIEQLMKCLFIKIDQVFENKQIMNMQEEKFNYK